MPSSLHTRHVYYHSDKMTLFSKIIAWDIPSHKIYEDEYTFAFLDINPVQAGHTLIVPKIEVDYFADVPEPYYTAVFQTAKKITPAIQKATGCKRIATMILGYEIPHFHYHLVPTNGLGDAHFDTKIATSEQELQAMQQSILSYLS